MSAVPFVIVAAAAVLVVVRRGRSLRRLLPSVPWPQGEVALVAAREIRERTRARAFRVGTGIVLLAVVAGVVIPKLTGGSASSETVGVVGTLSQPLRVAVVAAGTQLHTTVRLEDEPDESTATRGLQAGRLDLVLVGDRQVLVKNDIGSSTSTTALLARTLAATVAARAALQRSGLTEQQAAELTHVAPLPITGLHEPHKNTSRATTLYALIVEYVLLSQYGAWILTGVVEEKASRVIEILLATVRPVRLLAGKVAGIGLVALMQATLLIGVALGVGAAVGSDILRGAAPLAVFDSLLWLLLGYVLYCWVFAATGSLATRQEHLQSLAFPLQIPLLIGYIGSLSALGSGHPTAFLKVLAYLPPTAPFAMPSLVSLGAATWWQVLLSAVITVAATVVVARAAARIYLRAILRTGQRVRLRDVRRLEPSP
jgi:ABC-2 type transport system permease protein